MGVFTLLKFSFLSIFSILTLINWSYFVDDPLHDCRLFGTLVPERRFRRSITEPCTTLRIIQFRLKNDNQQEITNRMVKGRATHSHTKLDQGTDIFLLAIPLPRKTVRSLVLFASTSLLKENILRNSTFSIS